MTSASVTESLVTPACLSFFSIYCPELGPTDETFRDQILFYYSRTAKDARDAAKGKANGKISDDELKEEENERLRQIGLAQGMVGFAKSFSDGQDVDSVETRKSRIVMHELEQGWWVLASVDLTRLPAISHSNSTITSGSKKNEENEETRWDYSSREVSPAPLLLQQILTAHRVFRLHHGPSMKDLFYRLKRERFSLILDRFWTRFCKDWDVLLHGNPVVDFFGGMKLNAGGELGIGVGEEEWGSGEREVLEDLTRRTEGLVDCMVSRFGHPDQKSDGPELDDDEHAVGLPWMGCGLTSEPHDGVIFGGIGAISRPSLRDLSTWIQQIYTVGEQAYGVRDNPQRQRRKRQKRNPPGEDFNDSLPVRPKSAQSDSLRRQAQETSASQVTSPTTEAPKLDLPHDPRPALHERVASHDHAHGSPSVENSVTQETDVRPGIPPPIVSAVEQSLDKAVSGASKPTSPESKDMPLTSSTLGIANDTWVKYLTFGLGGAPVNATEAQSKGRPNLSRSTTAKSLIMSKMMGTNNDNESKATDEGNSKMKIMEPMPDGYAVAAKITEQKQRENNGYFLIGYRGDLQQAQPNGDTTDSELDDDDGERLLLRTLQVEARDRRPSSEEEDQSRDTDQAERDSDERSSFGYERLRVVVYVRRPFIYTLLFEQRAPSLQMSAFYKELHQLFGPLHKPLLSSTSASKIARRISESQANHDDAMSVRSHKSSASNPKPPPVMDMVYDPASLTVHTSIPNIPVPGTPAAEGFSAANSREHRQPWTRIEGLNVHSQILNTLDTSRYLPHEIERTSKTSRGWWVVWMRIPPFASMELQQREQQYEIEDCRIAFLIRKASDWVAPKHSGASIGSAAASRASSGMFSRYMSGKSEERQGGAGASGGLASGIGIDARKYVEGLLSLNR